MKKPRPPSLRELLKRPLRSPAEADRLAALVAERQAVLRERGCIALVVTGAIVLFGAIIAVTDTDANSSEILMMPAMFVLAAALAAPTAVRRLWAHPRLLAVQRRLLQDRGLGGGGIEAPETLLSDLEQRIDRAAALLPDRPPEAPRSSPSGGT